MRLLTERLEPSASDLREAVAPAPSANDLFAYADAVAADFERRGALQRMYKIRGMSARLREVTGAPLPFERLTPAVLRAFETHLLTRHKNAPNSVRVALSVLRSVVYRAIREGLAEQAHNPFFSFTPVRATRPERTRLTSEQMRRLETLDLPAGSLLWRTRAYFLFQFYGAGIRFGDLARLRWEHVTQEGEHLRLSYRMSKTGGLKALRLLPQARALLDAFPPREGSPYLFPILDGYDLSTPRLERSAISAQNALTNKYLKKLAALAEIKLPLSTHVARHSFADIARTRGWDVYAISKALGHANIKITESYLRGFDAEGLDDMMQSTFGA